MKNKIISFLLLGFMAMVQACLYSDNGYFQVDPVPDEPAVAEFTSNLDTLENPTVHDSLEVTYDISIQGGDLYYVDARVSNHSVYSSDTTQGSFWLHSAHVLYPGVDTLSVVFYYSSNTNSLGDVFEVEAAISKHRYAVDFKWGKK